MVACAISDCDVCTEPSVGSLLVSSNAEKKLTMFLADLFLLKILTGKRLVRLVMDVIRHGIHFGNVMQMCTDRKAVAVKHRESIISYETLFDQIASVSGYLHATHRIKQGSKVLVIVDNSIPSVILLPALSAIGCNIHVLGPIKDSETFKKTVDTSKYALVLSGAEEEFLYYKGATIYSITAVWNEAISHAPYKPFVKVRTSLSIFTGGTTGVAKAADRSNTLWQYLRVMVDLIKSLRLQNYNSVILPVPIYHSYGLSAMFLSLMLNKKLVLTNKFDATEVAREIETNNIEVAILIPQMLFKLLKYNLYSLRCIVSCSDVLPSSVFEKARQKFGNIIFNLYGTSETGLATIATPEMLAIKTDTIGRSIDGCKLKLVDENGNSILHVKSAFAMREGYINTGDIVTKNEQDWYFFHGRADHLIVINGVNVYPHALLEMAYKNEMVQHVAVKAYVNEDGFKKIKLVLQVKEGHTADENQFKDWWLQYYGTKFLPSAIEFRTDDQHIKLMRS
jgi:fatty-acyl-CoA synthase